MHRRPLATVLSALVIGVAGCTAGGASASPGAATSTSASPSSETDAVDPHDDSPENFTVDLQVPGDYARLRAPVDYCLHAIAVTDLAAIGLRWQDALPEIGPDEIVVVVAAALLHCAFVIGAGHPHVVRTEAAMAMSSSTSVSRGHSTGARRRPWCRVRPVGYGSPSTGR
jgi:hypothetical protein